MITMDELLKIRSLANDHIVNLPKPKDMTAQEFTSYCWVKAVSARLNLNLTVEMPTRWSTLTVLK